MGAFSFAGMRAGGWRAGGLVVLCLLLAACQPLGGLSPLIDAADLTVPLLFSDHLTAVPFQPPQDDPTGTPAEDKSDTAPVKLAFLPTGEISITTVKDAKAVTGGLIDLGSGRAIVWTPSDESGDGKGVFYRLTQRPDGTLRASEPFFGDLNSNHSSDKIKQVDDAAVAAGATRARELGVTIGDDGALIGQYSTRTLKRLFSDTAFAGGLTESISYEDLSPDGADARDAANANAAAWRGDYDTALLLGKRLAAGGNGMAAFSLGRMYETGLGVAADCGTALDWYRKAASNGVAIAARKVADLEQLQGGRSDQPTVGDAGPAIQGPLAARTCKFAAPAATQADNGAPDLGRQVAVQPAATPSGGRRIALVIGNEAYSDLDPLQKPVGDARAYAKLFHDKHFDSVVEKENLKRDEMDRVIADFIDSIQLNDTVVFVYSGHGWSDGVQNYIVGVDTPKAGSQTYLGAISVALSNGLNGVLDKMDKSGAKMRVAIIDACRNNPFAAGGKGFDRGGSFTKISDNSNGTFVIQSASVGETALDELSPSDPDPNGVFTRVFVPLLAKDMTLVDAAVAAQTQVRLLAGTVHLVQEPDFSTHLDGKGCLSDDCSDGDIAPNPSPPVMSPDEFVWQQIATSNNLQRLQVFPAMFPNSVHVSEAEALVKKLLAERDAADKQARAQDEAKAWAGVDALLGAASPPSDAAAQLQAFLDDNPDSAHRASVLSGLAGYYVRGTGGVDPDAGKAVEFYQQAADQNDAVAEAALADAYATGSGGLTKDDQKAAELYRRAAAQDNAEGQYGYGKMLETGSGGLTRDVAKAGEQYRAAADKGLAAAQHDVGRFYQHGLGNMPTDLQQAEHYYQLAADQGLADAQASLGYFYDRGLGGLSRDESQAIKYYKLAAAQGQAGAQNNLGLIYQSGASGVPADRALAAKYFASAADHGRTDSQLAVAALYGDQTSSLYYPERSVHYFQMAADAGNAKAAAKTAAAYDHGIGVTADSDLAVKYYRKAADKDQPEAIQALGVAYQVGRLGFATDLEMAATYFRKGADLGFAPSENDLGYYYAKGLGGLTRDGATAVKYYQQAADQGQVNAQTNLGIDYESGGDGLDRDYAKSFAYYQSAASHGFADAQYNLGRAYEFGLGVDKDPVGAYQWYYLAAAQGQSNARAGVTRVGLTLSADEVSRAVRQANAVTAN